MGTPDHASLRSAQAGWLNLARKVILSLLLLLLVFSGIPVSPDLFGVVIQVVLLMWGAIVVGLATYYLAEGSGVERLLLPALAMGAYAALAVPGVANEPSRTIDAAGPVVALTLAAQLPRRDLRRALRDWALLVAIALYVTLGVTATWRVLGLGGALFLVAVLLAPLLFETGLLLLRRLGVPERSMPAQVAVLAIATLLTVVLLSGTQLFNPAMPPFWFLLFNLLAGLLIALALLVGFLTRPFIEAAAGAGSGNGAVLARALVEVSHGPLLIALVIYVFVLLGAAG
jgi:hypothetical protein